MRELQESSGGTFDLSQLKSEAERRGIPANRVDALFTMLRNQGELSRDPSGAVATDPVLNRRPSTFPWGTVRGGVINPPRHR